ncbi:MAG: nucleotide exchange factor GrpE [Gammaproteobacteria bacterium]|nr:nucleotide exchange factor GrpE [Gammaproteobacteria bacterium]
MTNNEQSTPEAPENEGAVEGVVETGANNAVSPDVPSHGELTLLLEDARSKADEHWDQVLRTNAELENLRRRAKQDVENAHKYALEKFAQELLPVKDSLEMGLAAANGETDAAEAIKQLCEGTDLTLKMLSAAMEKSGIKEIDPVGETFNPEQHQAMSMQESEAHAPNTVMAVMQKGYQLNDRLIRPAMVVVSKAKA